MHPRTVAAAICLLAAAICARAGEEEHNSFYADAHWQKAQHAAAAAKLVIVARAIDVKPAKGKGWDGSYTRTDPRNPRQSTSTIHVDQEMTLEVVEVLRGEVASKSVLLRLGKVTLDYRTVQQFWYGLYRAKKIKNSRNRKLPVSYFALRKDRTYVLFVKGLEGGSGGNGGEKPPTAAHVDGATPVESPDGQLMRSLRGFCRELTLWDKPPALPQKQKEAVEKLVADLGADEYEAREKAEVALRAIGARIRPYLERAAKDPDEERSFRAREILEKSKPEPGKTEVPGAGVGARAPAIFRERPKPKPPPEPPPEPEPMPLPAPDAGDVPPGEDE